MSLLPAPSSAQDSSQNAAEDGGLSLVDAVLLKGGLVGMFCNCFWLAAGSYIIPEWRDPAGA